MRKASVKRDTNETRIIVDLDIDGSGETDISTGIGFFDHMLTLLGKHSGMDLRILCKGDLEVDFHHTVEDTGIVLGKAFLEALGDKKGIRRYSNVRIPMDEALAACDLDISGRPFLVYNASLKSRKVGEFDVCLAEEFFRAFSVSAAVTLHMNCEYGRNDHHMIEAMFKALAVAVKRAAEIDPRSEGKVPSTKGVI
ncbi:MAG: imidazoleglycerol-phosphate dehydratase HisB [Eubacteriales bacterium]|jgi:imidazoleglycerol-phosphate dehydratase|nr:imidazoleglycerol-phosphate dehydratase HisB [Eubacteriales bacterium]MDD4327812.1 imidazoleglycerol-phosphate dehydratase HisB [Eubacteriales bacterium]MDD4717862.1 imidazoleglycerol-phosphate dehydratase HisB [Eubacteriales bacterium]